jgi:hypothetical protein
MPRFLWTPEDRMKPNLGLAKINWSHPLARGLVGCWLFNEGAGNTAFCLGNNKINGVGSNISWGPSPGGICPIYNGSNSSFNCGNNTVFGVSSAMTVLCSFYMTAPPGAWSQTYLASKNWSYPLALGFNRGSSDVTTSLILRTDTDTTHNGNKVLSLNTLYDVSFTYDGSYIRLYINGLSDNTPAAKTGTLNDTSTIYQIGCRNSSGYFTGSIIKSIIWNRALSPVELIDLSFNPYCFLQPIVTRTYYVIGGGTQSQSQTGDGGAVAGGSATQVQAQTFPAAGGGVAGGAATQLQAPTNPASGGGIAGGTATQAQTHTPAFSASGGAVAGGAATQAQTYSPAFSATGGAVAGGTADQLQAATFPASGGAVAGGTATQSSTGSYAFVASGGAVAGGAAGQLQEQTFPASGGGVAGGAAITEGINAGAYAFEASGGAVAGGSADQIQAKTNPASGGGVAGGTATVSTYQLQAVSFSASGGGIAGGAATVTRTLSSTIQEYPFSPASSTEGEFPFYQPREDDFFPASSAGDEFEPYIPRG